MIASRVEHSRSLVRGYYIGLMRAYVKRALSDPNLADGGAPFSQSEDVILFEMADNGFVLAEYSDERRVNLYFRIQAAAVEPFLDKLKLRDDQEKGLLRERDRLIAQFDKRRRDRVIDAARRVDTPAVPPPSSAS